MTPSNGTTICVSLMETERLARKKIPSQQQGWRKYEDHSNDYHWWKLCCFGSILRLVRASMQGLLDLALSPGFCPEFGRDAPVLVGKQDALGGMLDLGQRGEVGAWTAL